MNDDVKFLVEQYKRELPTSTHRRRAQLETQIWAVAPATVRKRANAKREYLYGLLGGPKPDYDIRYTMLHAGKIAEPLWARLEGPHMPLWTAIGLLRQAKKVSVASKMTVEDSLATVLADYDSHPVVHLKDGKSMRRRAGSRLPHHKQVTVGKPKVKDESSFWAKQREICAPWAAKQLEGANPIFAEKLYREFEGDLRVLFQTWQGKVNRLRQENKADAAAIHEVTRFQIIKSCRKLGMDPPKIGKPVDMAKAKKQKNMLARQYHPDPNDGGGNPGELQAVMESYFALQRYNEQFDTDDDERNTGSHSG